MLLLLKDDWSCLFNCNQKGFIHSVPILYPTFLNVPYWYFLKEDFLQLAKDEVLELTDEVGEALECVKQTSWDQIVLSCVLFDGEEEQVTELFTLTTTVSCLATGLSSPDPLTHSPELSIFVSVTPPIV